MFARKPNVTSFMFISPLSFAADCKVIFNLIKNNQDSDFSFNIKVCEMFLVGICSGMMFNGSHGPANVKLHVGFVNNVL